MTDEDKDECACGTPIDEDGKCGCGPECEECKPKEGEEEPKPTE